MKTILFMMLFATYTIYATEINGRFIVIDNSESVLNIKIQINTNTGNDDLGGTTFTFTYDSTNLSFSSLPVAGTDYIFHSFDGGNYSRATVTRVLGNQIWLNIELELDNYGTIVSSVNGWTDVATISFIKKLESTDQPILWNTESIFWSVYDGDNSTLWTKGIFSNNLVTEVEPELPKPDKFELSQNYPNPFNPSTKIKFSLKEEGNVKLSIYNMIGEKIFDAVDGYLLSGEHNVEINGNDLASGIYIYRLDVENKFTDIRKMILLK